MSKYAIEQRVLGLAKESVRGTAETTPTKWLPVMKESDFDYKLMLLDDDAIRGLDLGVEFPKVSGRKRGVGKIRMALDAQTIGEFMYGLLGDVSSSELQTITISSSNQHIDFNIGAGDLDATIATGSYVIGTSSATASTLCKAIKDALFAADATGTYTVTYSRTTKKFTITRSTGTLNIKWTTGSNVANGAATTLGYTADDTGSLSYTSDSEVQFLFSHTFSRSETSIERPSYTFFIDRGLGVKKYNLGTIKKMKINAPVDQLIMVDMDMIVKTEASGSIGTASFPTQRYMAFQNANFKIGGATEDAIKTWSLEIDNGAAPLEVFNQSQDIDDILVRGKQNIKGTFTIYFESETERAKFLANTTTSAEALIEGSSALAGAEKLTVDLVLPKINYTAYPYDEEDSLLAAKVAFEAVYDSTADKQISVIVKNQDASY